jgi:hypothetical protein
MVYKKKMSKAIDPQQRRMRIKAAVIGLAAVALAGIFSQMNLGNLETFQPVSPTPPLDIIILAGQSNMSGMGSLAELPTGFPVHADRLFIYANSGNWTHAMEPVDNPLGQVDPVSLDRAPGVGPGLALADHLAAIRPGRSVGLVPCACSGTSIDQWAPHQERTTLYGSCLARAREAAAKGRIRALVWYQGESDTHSTAQARAWPQKFASMVEAWRKDLNQPELPVVFTQIGPLGKRLSALLPAWQQMQELQAALRLPGVNMVKTADLTIFDGVHLDTASQLRLGRRYAEALLKVL